MHEKIKHLKSIESIILHSYILVRILVHIILKTIWVRKRIQSKYITLLRDNTKNQEKCTIFNHLSVSLSVFHSISLHFGTYLTVWKIDIEYIMKIFQLIAKWIKSGYMHRGYFFWKGNVAYWKGRTEMNLVDFEFVLLNLQSSLNQYMCIQIK